MRASCSPDRNRLVLKMYQYTKLLAQWPSICFIENSIFLKELYLALYNILFKDLCGEVRAVLHFIKMFYSMYK